MVEIGRRAAGRMLLTYEKVAGHMPAPPAMLATFREVLIGEREPGIVGLSVPVYDQDGVMLGALALSCPSIRFDEARIAAIAPQFMLAAQRLVRVLRRPFMMAIGVSSPAPDRLHQEAGGLREGCKVMLDLGKEALALGPALV